MHTNTLSTTGEEDDTLQWCCLALTDEQVDQCQEEALEIAGAELHEDAAAELLVRTLARIVIRNVRAERSGGVQ